MNFYSIPFSVSDSVEMLEVFESKTAYPSHYHDCFCLSLVTQGIFVEDDKLIDQNCLLITNPNQVHINKTYGELSYSLTTLYINHDTVKYALKTQANIRFFNMVYDIDIIKAIHRLIFALKAEECNKLMTSNLLLKALILLKPFINHYDQKQPSSCDWIEEIQDFILNNVEQKVFITDLESIAKLDKFKLIRQFKAHVGMTPIQYLTLQRIIVAKHLIQEGLSLNETALSVGFYDQSNFCNYFKRYVGVTPKVFQRAVCNMFQD